MGFGKLDKIDEIWGYLLASNKRIVSTRDVFEACRSRGFKEYPILQSMTRKGYLLRSCFKGVYLIRKPEEYLNRTLELSAEEAVAGLLNYRFGSRWYFGLSSADYFGGRSWQSLRELNIITNDFEPQKTAFMGLTLVFRNLKYGNFNKGIEVRQFGKTSARFSNQVRTALDYCYYYLKLNVPAFLLACRELAKSNKRIIRDSRLYSDYPLFNPIIERLAA